MDYLKIIRLPNLLLLALMLLVLRYGMLLPQGVLLALAHWQFALLVAAVVLLAAAGYVINDIFDQPADAENKPARALVGKTISESAAYSYYAALNIAGVGCGFWLSNLIGRPGFAALFIFVAALLYFYATNLKGIAVVGNLVVALLLAIAVLVIVVFDIVPATDAANQQEMRTIASVILDYAIFAFAINLVREMVKDLEDINGDYNQGLKTLPIVLGLARTAKVVCVVCLVPAALLGVYIYRYYFNNGLYIALVYSLVFVLAPLLFCAVQLWEARSKKQFALISLVLKLVVFFGIGLIAVAAYNIRNHV